ADKKGREYGRISRRVLGLGMLVSGVLVVAAWLASVPWWVIVEILLVLFGVFAVLAVVVASMRTAPVKVVRKDRARGVVRLRFRNPDYVPAVVPQLDAGR